ncbi:MAG: LacI family transcriptional regulator [Candidatus Omnitrophica bacterium]|nr:LacI family transcriptional regulator [Candidatus Omnitrophota bacterium]
MGQITQEDIARRLNLSRATVSLTLNRRASAYRIRPETQQQVLQACRQLGYSRNMWAASLRARKNNLVGIVGAAYQVPVRQARQNFIAQYFKDRGFRVVLQDFHWAEDKISLLKEMEELRPEALIVAEPEPETVIEYLKSVKEKGVVVVLVDGPQAKGINQVRIDRQEAVYKGVSHLFRQGYEKVFLTLPKNFSYWAMAERFKGFLKACREFGEKSSPWQSLIWNNDQQYDDSFCLGYQIGQQLWRQKKIFPFGIMALNDQVAIGLMKFLLEKGVKIPNEVGLVGSENLTEARFVAVPLTSVSFPVKELAEKVGEIVLRRIAGQPGWPRSVTLKPELVVRESSLRKPGAGEGCLGR